MLDLASKRRALRDRWIVLLLGSRSKPLPVELRDLLDRVDHVGRIHSELTQCDNCNRVTNELQLFQRAYPHVGDIGDIDVLHQIQVESVRAPQGNFARATVGTTLVLTQPKREPELALGSRHKPPALAVVSGSVPPIARKHLQLPSGSFLSTKSTLPRICFVSPPGESTYEAVN